VAIWIVALASIKFNLVRGVQGDQQRMEEQTGISSSMTEDDIKEFVEQHLNRD
jgi:hypothetical protein